MKIQTPKNWRISQTLFNFFEWLHAKKDYPTGRLGDRCADIFFIDDIMFKKLYKEYLDTLEDTYETDEL